MKNISELLDSLSAKPVENALTPANVAGPTGKGSGTNDNSFGQVIAKVSDQRQNGNNTNPAPVSSDIPSPTPVITPSAVTPADTNNQTPTLSSGAKGMNEAARVTLLVSEQIKGVKPQDVASIEKSFFAMASGLANLLFQAQQLTGENSSQIQAQLVANSGGQITPAEAAQLVSAVQSFVNNLPQGQNPLDLNKQDQNQLLGQMLQQMLQNQQIAFAQTPAAGIQGDNQSVSSSQAVTGASQANTLANVTLRFMFTDEQFVVPSQSALNNSLNFQPIPRETVNSILNTLAQLGAQQTLNLPVTIVNPASSAQGQQAAANGQNLQALFKVLLQAGAGQVVLQSSMAQNTGNPVTNQSFGQGQGQTGASPVSQGSGQSFWSSVNFRRINELILRFTNFIGQSNTTVAVQSPGNQGPAQMVVANTPSAVTAQVGSSVGPQASPVAIAQLPNGDQQEIVNNVLTPNTIQLQPTPLPNLPVTATTRVETQNQTLLSKSQLTDQGAAIQVLGQTQGSSFTSIPEVTSQTPSTISFNVPSPVNTNPGLTPFTVAPNTVAPAAGINPPTAPNPSGSPVLPGTQVVTPAQVISQANMALVSQANAVAQTQNTSNQAANPGVSTPAGSVAQSFSGSVAAVNVFNQGMAQNQANPTQTPLVANPVQPSGTVPAITAQAVSAITELGASTKLQPGALQDKNSLADLLSSQNQPALSSNGLVYTMGRNGEVQAVNAAGNQIPINAQDLIGQISSQISNRSGELKNISTISFQLVPENLGRMTIQVSLVDQSVSARILVTNPDVKDALQQHMVDLKTSLNQAGLQIDQLQVQVQGGGASLLTQYYQFQQEGYGSSLPFSGGADSMGTTSENEPALAPLSLRKSLVDLLA